MFFDVSKIINEDSITVRVLKKQNKRIEGAFYKQDPTIEYTAFLAPFNNDASRKKVYDGGTFSEHDIVCDILNDYVLTNVDTCLEEPDVKIEKDDIMIFNEVFKV